MQLDSIFQGAAALLAIVLVRTLLRAWQQRETERRLGCKPPTRFRHRLPWGTDLYRERVEGVKAGRYNRVFQDHFNRYGATFEEYALGVRTINTMEVENIQTVVALKSNDYGKSATRNKAIMPFLGHGIFSEDGPAWKRSRDLIKPLFKRAEPSDVDGFGKHVDRMLAAIPRNGDTVDLQPLFAKLFLDSSTEFIFGESLNSLVDTSGAVQEFLNAFSQALIGAGKRGNLAGGRLGFLFMFDKTWDENIRKVHALVDRHVARALAETDPNSSTASSTKESESGEGRYVLLTEMAKVIRDPIRLRFEVLNVFFPARDSTAIALSNTVFHLARNPKIWTQLRTQALALGDRPLTVDVLRSLPLFRYALFEGIRLQGPSGRIQRTAVRDTVLPRGGGPDGSSPVFVPKGTVVALNNFSKFHDAAVWGEDVEVFRPSRFEGRVLTWEFVPFMGGPRICPAQQQVITQAVYLLVRMVREFETIENRDPCMEYVELIKMLCESRNGVKVALHPAKDT